jgi:hypothetical protein
VRLFADGTITQQGEFELLREKAVAGLVEKLQMKG